MDFQVLFVLSSQFSQNLALKRPHRYISWIKWTTLSSSMMLTPWSVKGGDVGVGSVAPWSVEVRLDGKYFTVCDDESCSELGEYGFCRLVVVADVINFDLVDILLVDGGDDGLDCHV